MRVEFTTDDYSNKLSDGYSDGSYYYPDMYGSKTVQGDVQGYLRESGITYAIVLVDDRFMNVDIDELRRVL